MLRALIAVIVAALAVAVAWWVVGIPGQVTAVIGQTTIEAATPVAILLGVLAFLVLYFGLRLIAGLIGLPRWIRNRTQRRQRRQGEVAITRTLIALAAGEAGEARREAIRARRLLGDTPNTLLLQAESARRAGREGEAETAYRTLSERQDAAFLGLRGLLRQAVAREDWTAAAAIAAQAEAAHPGSDWLRSERTRLALHAGQWREALALTGSHGPQAALAAAAADAETDPDAARRLARQAFKADPGMSAAAIAYAKRLREAGREARAQEVIRSAWSHRPQPDLATFALAPIEDKLARFRAAEKLAQAKPDDAESQFLLAETALASGLTGEARRHAEAARDVGMSQRRLWRLFADIADAEGNAEAVRMALRRAADAEPDPAWRCSQCGTVHSSWEPVCRSCHAAGTMEWTTGTALPVLEKAEDPGALPLDPAKG
jgi:HemY protein